MAHVGPTPGIALPKYTEYALQPGEGKEKELKANEFFTESYIPVEGTPSKCFESLFSLAGLAQKALQQAHNEVATGKAVKCRGLKKAAIALGFALTTIAAAIETIVRLPIAVLGGIIGGLTTLCNKEIGGMIAIITAGSIIYNALMVAQSAVSTVTHVTHHDDAISYAGQANKYLFRGSATTLLPQATYARPFTGVVVQSPDGEFALGTPIGEKA